jgi:signal transduction histidine kinase
LKRLSFGSLKRRTALIEDVLLREEILALERNAQQVSRLVSDCLDMTRVATGKMAIEKEVVDLNEIVRVSVTAVEDRAQGKGLSIFMMLPKSGPLIWADRTRLEQIVVNVLMNAVKYTDTGLIAVTVRIREEEAGISSQRYRHRHLARVPGQNLRAVPYGHERMVGSWRRAGYGIVHRQAPDGITRRSNLG